MFNYISPESRRKLRGEPFDLEGYLAEHEENDQLAEYIREKQTAGDVAADTTKRVGRSLVDQPGALTQSLGTILDSVVRGMAAKEIGIAQAAGVPFTAQDRKDALNTESAVGRTIKDVGRQMRKDAGELYTGDFAPDPVRDDTLLGKVADSTGPVAAALATPGGVLAKTASGALLNSQGAADDAEQRMLARGATEQEARDEAARQFVLNLPLGALESVAWGRLLGRYGKALEKAVEEKFGKTALRRILRATGEQSVIEAGEEGLQQLGQNVAAKATFDRERKLSEGVKDSMTVGAVMGGGMGGTFQSAAEGATKLADTGKNKPESRATLELQQQQLTRGERVAQMFPLGTRELALPEGMQRVETPRGVFHFDPRRMTADEILSLSQKGRENLILGLGDFNKDEVLARAAKGEPLATVTERNAAGTEARSAVVTPSTLPSTQAQMEAGKSPGHTVKVENIVDTLRARDAAETAQQKAAREAEENARAERAAEKQARRERFDEVLNVTRDTYRRRDSVEFAAIEGALNAVKYYAEDNSVGLQPEQREAARTATAALQKLVDERAGTERAARDAVKAERAAAAAAQEQQRKEQRDTERRELREREKAIRKTGIDPATQQKVYDRAPDDVLAEWAAAGDTRAEREMMERNERGHEDTHGEDLLAVLKKVKLPWSDKTMGGELEELRKEWVSFGQRGQLFDTKPGSLDSVAETLRTEYGFSFIETPADVINYAQQALRGEVVRPDWAGNERPQFARLRVDSAVREGEAAPGETPAPQARQEESRQGGDVSAAAQSQAVGDGRAGRGLSEIEAKIERGAVERDVAARAVNLFIDVQDGRGRWPTRIETKKRWAGNRTRLSSELEQKLITEDEARALHAAVTAFDRGSGRFEWPSPELRRRVMPYFARQIAPAGTAPLTDAEVETRWQALRAAFPELEREWQFVRGEVQDELARAGYAGDVPDDVQAAVLPPELLSQWQRKRAERGVIVFAARMLQQPGKSTRLLLHELAHQYWDTLPAETQAALRDLYESETTTRTGPLFDGQGEPVTDISFLPEDFTRSELEADPDLPLREWFAERLAQINAEWANGRVTSRDTLLARVAFELRELLQRVQQWLAQVQGRRVESALLEREFRRFLRQGARQLDRRGQETALSYAREAAGEDVAWKKTVADYFANPSRRDMLPVGRVPEVLRAVGVSDAPMVMPPSVIAKVTGGKHSLTREMVEQIPGALRDPIMVFDSASVPDAVTVLTQLKHGRDNVLAAIHLDKPAPNKPANIIVSLHERPAGQIRNWVEMGLLRYVHQAKTRAYFLSARLQLPREGSKAGNPKLLTEQDVVKMKASPEFARGRAKPTRASADVQAELAQVQQELEGLQNSNEPAEEIEERGRSLDQRAKALQSELIQTKRAEQAAAAVSRVDDPDVQRITEGPLAGAVLVPNIIRPDRRAALRSELERGRRLLADAQQTGNAEAKAEGERLVRLATERLNEEFPGWETAPAPVPSNGNPKPTAPASGPEALIAEMIYRRNIRDMLRVDAIRAQLDREFPGWRETEAALKDRSASLALQLEDATGEEAERIRAERRAVNEKLAALRKPATPERPASPPRETPAQDLSEAAAAQPGDTERDPFKPETEAIEQAYTAAKRAELEGQSLADPNWLNSAWQKVRDGLRAFRGAVPELPAFPWSTLAQKDDPHLKANPSFYQRLKLGLRLLRTSNEYVQRNAEDAVAAIVRPLLAAGRGKFDADAYAKLRRRQEQIRKLREEGKPVPAGVDAEVRALQSKLAETPLMLFQRTVLYLDLDWRARNIKDDEGNAIALPMGFTQQETAAVLKELGERIAISPHKQIIEEALRRHMALVSNVAADLKERGLLAPEHLANPYYFPHVVIEKIGPQLAQVQENTNSDFRGYLITPVGSRKAIETDYIRAMYYHMVQVLAHNQRADIVRDYFRHYDIMEQVRDVAKNLSRRYGRPVSWKEAFHTQFAERGYVIYGAGEADMFPAVQIDRDRLAARLGVALTSEDIHKQLERLGLEGIKLLPGDLQEVSRAGEKEYWILPEKVADALRGMARRAEHKQGGVERALAGLQSLWKKHILYAPWNYLRYEYGNTMSDLEKLFSADPLIFSRLGAAAKELRAFYDGQPAGADLQQALKLGVLQSVTASELKALPELRAFEELQTEGQRVTRQVLSRLSSILLQPVTAPAGLGDRSTLRLSQLRESVFRFAKFKADLERMRNGASPVYAGAFWRDVENVQDSQPGAGDAAFLKAAMISRSTFGDYGDLSVGGQKLRDLLIPFYSWIEINFRYHANLFRNYRDAIQAGELSRAEATTAGARAAAVLASGLSRRAAAAFLFRLALPYAVVQLWNSVMHADIEDELSEEDRRRFHLNVGRTDDGRPLVVYLPTAFADVVKWFSGPEFARLAVDYTRGRIDLATAFGEWRDRLVPDFLNNIFGSVGPVFKAPYTLLSKKSAFPDVTEQRTVPSYDMARVILGQMTDQFTAEMLVRAFNKDYYASKDLGDWARQLILQARVRDPEQWAFYTIKDKAAEFLQQQTGQRRENNYDAPDQEVLRNFRRAIYRGDVEAATRFYQRLLAYGYTSERFAQSIKSQDPLSELPRELRRDFVASLSEWEREQMLRRAYRYYYRLADARGEEPGLFPRQRMGEAGATAYRQRPQTERLRSIVENRELLPDDQLDAAALIELRRSLSPAVKRPSAPRPHLRR